MAEADPSAQDEGTSEHPADTLLAGLENGDLSRGIYEGGFKTWECALDLASLIISQLPPFDPRQDWQIVELGAGSAIPSLAFLRKWLFQRRQRANAASGTLKVTLCDYNEDVLRLATAPNVFLNYGLTSDTNRPPAHGGTRVEDGGDLDLEDLGGESFVTTTISELASNDMSFEFISGGWGDQFFDLIKSPPPPSSSSTRPRHNHSPNLLIFASETIYSPSSIKTFTQTLLLLLRFHHQNHPGVTAKAWIAAKKVYFGVGGGVDEFAREVQGLGGMCTTIWKTQGTGVERVVLEISVT